MYWAPLGQVHWAGGTPAPHGFRGELSSEVKAEEGGSREAATNTGKVMMYITGTSSHRDCGASLGWVQGHLSIHCWRTS